VLEHTISSLSSPLRPSPPPDQMKGYVDFHIVSPFLEYAISHAFSESCQLIRPFPYPSLSANHAVLQQHFVQNREAVKSSRIMKVFPMTLSFLTSFRSSRSRPQSFRDDTAQNRDDSRTDAKRGTKSFSIASASAVACMSLRSAMRSSTAVHALFSFLLSKKSPVFLRAVVSPTRKNRAQWH